MFLIDDTKDADATNTHGNTQTSAPKQSSGPNAFQKSIDYLKASKNKAQAYEQILTKYGDSFSDKQKEALKKFTK
jgi:hypothetical protein